jgi:hypothetical protein
MASVAIDATLGASFDTISLNTAPQFVGTVGAAALVAGMLVYLGSDGLVHPCDATSANAPLAGIVAVRSGIGNPCTVFGIGAKCHYAASGTFTYGAKYFLDVTSNAGGLSTVATTGDAVGVVRAISDTDIQVIRMA